MEFHLRWVLVQEAQDVGLSWCACWWLVCVCVFVSLCRLCMADAECMGLVAFLKVCERLCVFWCV